ncbi:hypothetical protein [Flavobacterium sp. I3-2]|uniref:hypothetical protein n=1 Tax=Flavobacterium sp. I3-2 TaxID=2748319 RepID=UPI0015A8060B|nr:hypothetical protein [Flavobacterium sp. I3-2]
MKYWIFCCVCFMQTFVVMSQTNFYNQIKDYNLSEVIKPNEIFEVSEGVKRKMLSEALIYGFIGDDYQRFDIKYFSVVKNEKNPYEYFVSGKTRVKNNICSFQGTFLVKEAFVINQTSYPDYKSGFIVFEIHIFENKTDKSSGMISGKLISNFIIDLNNTLTYDALDFFSDSFANNQFIGKWTSYKTKKSKKCHWGDFRIPESGDLDIGAGEFSPNSKYFNKGWKSLILINSSETELDVDKGLELENFKWWE